MFRDDRPFSRESKKKCYKMSMCLGLEEARLFIARACAADLSMFKKVCGYSTGSFCQVLHWTSSQIIISILLTCFT